ncbi:hypothetical protein HDU97_000176 [Phlyctochytrium planicorne]|nr:hypothetical protein HDU97_000176 [Phlyctochytrium planicorne]
MQPMATVIPPASVAHPQVPSIHQATSSVAAVSSRQPLATATHAASTVQPLSVRPLATGTAQPEVSGVPLASDATPNAEAAGVPKPLPAAPIKVVPVVVQAPKKQCKKHHKGDDHDNERIIIEDKPRRRRHRKKDRDVGFRELLRDDGFFREGGVKNDGGFGNLFADEKNTNTNDNFFAGLRTGSTETGAGADFGFGASAAAIKDDASAAGIDCGNESHHKKHRPEIIIKDHDLEDREDRDRSFRDELNY